MNDDYNTIRLKVFRIVFQNQFWVRMQRKKLEYILYGSASAYSTIRVHRNSDNNNVQ